MQTRVVPALLVLATLAEVVAMAHHPSFATADIAAATQGILATGGIAAWVHGVLIGLMLLIAFGMSEFVLREGASRPLMRAGAIAYGAGVIVMIMAALVSGFVVPGIVGSLTSGTPTVDVQTMKAIFILTRVLNRTCANTGALAISAGIACWSLALLWESGFRRVIGVIGCVVAFVPVAALLSGAMRLNVLGMSAVVVIQGIWNLAVALLLCRWPTTGRGTVNG